MEIEQEPKLYPPEESEPYTFQNLPIYISIDTTTVALVSTFLQVSPDGFTFLQDKGDDQWFTIYCSFSNTNSVGINGNNLMIFVGDQEVEEEQETPEIIKTISTSLAGGNVQLNGYCFTISIDFGKEGHNVLKEVHDIFVNYMGDADDHASRYDEDQDMENMISAEDIDQDGNIIQDPHNGQESEQEEQDDPIKK